MFNATIAPPGKVIIIGGGIAGLACGCYLQMNGYATEILEAGSVLGGLCAAWRRGPYLFDGCLRWLLGASPGSAFHRVWRELGAIDARLVVNHDEFLRVEGAGGEVLSLPADLDQIACEFKRVAPEDGRRIDELVRAARRCAPIEPPMEKPIELMSAGEKIRTGLGYLPMLPAILKWKNRSAGAYVATYKNLFLREALMSIAGHERASALVLVMVLAFRSRRSTGYVTGGSRVLAQAIADRHAGLGGRVRYNARVTTVTVKDGCATGVRCEDGTVLSASTVVSCADGHATIFEMLDGRFVNKHILRAYRTFEPFPAIIHASLGIDQTFPNVPRALSLPLPRPIRVDDQTWHSRLVVSVFASDSALCPRGKTVMTVALPSRWEFWVNLRNSNPDAYLAEKERVLRDIIEIAEARFPGVARRLECSDLATPATFVRHTGNWRGSSQGWLPTPRILGRRLPQELPGLRGLYMAGHWIEPGGGLPAAAFSGRYVAQLICARDGRVFSATEPSSSCLP